MDTGDAGIMAVWDDKNEIKHQFLHLSCHPPCIDFRPVLLVNKLLEISYDCSDWHGSAVYRSTALGGVWVMTYHPQADVNEMKTV